MSMVVISTLEREGVLLSAGQACAELPGIAVKIRRSSNPSGRIRFMGHFLGARRWIGAFVSFALSKRSALAAGAERDWLSTIRVARPYRAKI